MSITSTHSFFLHDGANYSPIANEFGAALRLEVLDAKGNPTLCLWIHADRPELLRQLARECLKTARALEDLPAKKDREELATFVEELVNEPSVTPADVDDRR